MMKSLVRNIAAFWSDEVGSLATNIALMAPILMGVSALAVDIGYYRVVDNKMQSAADAGALAAVRHLDNPSYAMLQAVEYAHLNVPESYGTIATTTDIELGTWDAATRSFTVASGVEVNALRLTVERSAERGNAPIRFFGQIFGGEGATLSATSIAARQQWTQYEPPVSVSLNTSAGDFNEMYVYCYDYQADESVPVADRRTQMTLIANNFPAGTNVWSATNGVVTQEPDGTSWPICEAGESLSFRQRNIRHAKAMSHLWSQPWQSPGRPEHNYYTDTTIVDGVEQFNLGYSILETVRCDSFEDCDPSNPSNILPSGSNRSPNISTEPCEPGKYVYFAWEDRPDMGVPAYQGHWTDPYWTDLDYDDNRIVMKCPETGSLGDGRARLVQ